MGKHKGSHTGAKGQLRINGKSHPVTGAPSASVLDILRGPLNLTGAKRGCDIGTCGTCSVLCDGRVRKTCTWPLQQALAEDPAITTIESFDADGPLHPMQQAFVDHGAVQCGFCTPGLVLAACALARRKPSPSTDDVGHLLKSQLCRCTGYQAIVDAVLDGAGRIRGESPSHAADPGSGIGRSPARGDAIAKVTGACRYTGDQRVPDMLHGVVLRSDRPHAMVLRIHSDAALALPGVLRVLTHHDVPGEKHFGNALADMPALAVDRVRFVGDSVALVIAQTEPQARAGAQALRVDYQDLPIVTSPAQGLAEGAPAIHPGGNVASHQTLRKGDVDAAFASADVVVEARYQTQAQEHACLESEVAIAWVEGPTLILHAPSQNVYFDRREVARVTGWNKADVHIRQQPMGAAFGAREDLYCQHHAALASIAMGGRPVRVAMTREETFLATTKRHPFFMHYRLASTAEGRIVGLDATVHADTGAYASWAPNILRKALVHGAGAYAIDHVRIDAWSVYTNNGYAGAFRGFGAPQVFFAVESMVDELATRLGLDPVAVRRLNKLEVGRTTATGQLLHASVGLGACIDAAVDAIDDPRYGARHRQGDWQWGLGMAHSFYGIGYGGGIPDIGSAVLELLPDGRIQLRISTVDYGQGSSTLFPQIVCQELGLQTAQVDLITGQSQLCPDSGSTVASRQTYISGNAVLLACGRIIKHLRKAAAAQWGVQPDQVSYQAGQLHSGSQHMSLAELAQHGPIKTQARFKAKTSRLDPETGQGDAYWPYAFGAQVACVRVNLRTGRVVVDRLIAAQDVGRALNPQMVEGQIRGAVAMGVGLALTEDYRVEHGIPIDRNFDTYKLPMHADCPRIDPIIIEDPDPTGPYGAKGVGEPPIVMTAPAIANAVAHATGVRIRRLPLNPPRVLSALRDAGVAL